MKIIAALLLAALFLVSAEGATNQPPRYRVQRIEQFVDYDGSAELLLNNRGQVTALVHDEDATPRLFIRGRKKTEELPLPSGTSGSLNLAGRTTHKTILLRNPSAYSAYRYHHGKLLNLTNLLPYKYFNMVAMNSRGRIVGGAQREAGPPITAFSYYRGRLRELGTGLSDVTTLAFAVNNRGQAVGGAMARTTLGNATVGTIRAVLFTKHGGVFLDTRPGANSSLATGINERGTVIGRANELQPVEEEPGNFRRGFVYRHGSMEPLHPLPGDLRSEPNDINRRDQIVGRSTDENWDTRAVLFQNGQTYDLNELIRPERNVELSDALSINDRGIIVAVGYSGESFLLIPE